jgi:hypothetical protein
LVENPVEEQQEIDMEFNDLVIRNFEKTLAEINETVSSMQKARTDDENEE